MIGLFSAPAVMRLPDCASTPVRSPVAVGHKVDFTSRVTCWEARASSRATEICGLFLIANASACFKVRDIGAPGVWGAEDGDTFPGGTPCGKPVCGTGAAGRLCAVFALISAWAKLEQLRADN